MLGTTFSHETVRSYVVAFGTLFNSLQVWRKDSAGAISQTLDVPLSYAPKEKWLARLIQDPKLENDVGITLPRMSYELVSMVYAADRKLNTMQRVSVPSLSGVANKQSYAWAPVPYDFFFTLFIYARNNRDASMIVEQILPFFTPDFTISIKEMTGLKVNLDIPIILNNLNKEETYEGNFDAIRSIVWTLDFTLKGVLFGPVRETNIIKKAYIDFFIPSSGELVTGNARPITSGSATQIRLANTSSTIDNFYRGGVLNITAGTGLANGHVISSYNGANQVITVANALPAVPDATSAYSLTYFNPLASATNITPEQMAASKTASRIYTQPGLTATGLPTSNGTTGVSVGVGSIDANDDYGYITTVTFWDGQGKRRNLKTGNDE